MPIKGNIPEDKLLIIDREAREIMYLVASICPPVRLFVCLCALSYLTRLTYDLKFGAKKSYYQSEVFVCVFNQWACAVNCADAVDRLLIFITRVQLELIATWHNGWSPIFL